ncbi:alpha/beta-hydrolase [Hypoxylon sp. NC1633]|nr:alpha/beta-hydrolase [Hypoxylon sp. NC1633]
MTSLMHIPPGILGTQPSISRTVLLTTAVTAAAWLSLDLILRPRTTKNQLFTPSPRTTKLPALSEQEIADLPYPPNALPGGRDAATPYGSIRVYEWGPEDGERVLLVHGISTPTVALGDLGHELAERGYRVMLFDLFGRGYSDAPSDLDYDSRLYVTQILLVLASSRIPWTAFHLVGYSLGGGLCVAFARYFPQRLSSLTLIASCGLIRAHHVGWQSRLLYSSGVLPEFMVRGLVRRRIRPKDEKEEARPPPQSAGGADIASAESKKVLPNRDGDANGGDGFDSASISKFRPGVTVSSVVRWQVDYHEGFVTAFLSTIRNAPIYAPQEDWKVLSAILGETRKQAAQNQSGSSDEGLRPGNIFMVLGRDDPVVVAQETIEDAERVLGSEGVEIAVLPGGHELPITASSAVANAMESFWGRR